ncbi:TetR/AcrR family transcriptional regulator [Paenarthrobacter nitroguajacolicus]|uniref:TetR/AcrR family transcriptional regulator n=1 Tax=Paenarthrobacter nitroguajacolicus TaxID=211146 RepID=UPI00248BA0E3|nr:hypothetical protein [Paenarthrobacter nitroguajacolicus]MDI2036480.1 hypothetical protein [Paenarthrobacter nitroguajacolicus]
MRSDTRRNKQQLLQAVAEEIRENPGGLSMQSVAVRAKVGVTSAYRYYSSLDELLAAYTLQPLEELGDFSTACPASGPELFRTVITRWVELVLEHGEILVQLRSRHGYLERLDLGDPVIAATHRIWERPIQGLMEDRHLTPANLRRALSVCNALTDPREILDLHQTEGMTPKRIAALLAASLAGAMSAQGAKAPLATQ